MSDSDDIIRVGSEIPVVVSVEIRRPYTLIVSFKDGKVQETRFSPEDFTGVFEPMKDPVYFASAFVDSDSKTVVWPNGVDLDPCVLYDPSLRQDDPVIETQKREEQTR